MFTSLLILLIVQSFLMINLFMSGIDEHDRRLEQKVNMKDHIIYLHGWHVIILLLKTLHINVWVTLVLMKFVF